MFKESSPYNDAAGAKDYYFETLSVLEETKRIKKETENICNKYAEYCGVFCLCSIIINLVAMCFYARN